MAEEKKNVLDKAKELLTTLMSSIKEEEKPTEMAAPVEGSPEEEAKETPAEEKAEDPTGDESENPEAELETAKATIEQLQKDNADLTAKLAQYENDATLMSEEIGKVKEAFETYKTTKMSSVKLEDVPAKKVEIIGENDKHTSFLKETMRKLQ